MIAPEQIDGQGSLVRLCEFHMAKQDLMFIQNPFQDSWPHHQFTSLSWSLRDRNAERFAPDLSTRWLAGMRFSKAVIISLVTMVREKKIPSQQL